MKKIYNRFGGFSKLRIALLLGFIAMGLTAWSQVTPNGKKNAAKSNVSIPIEMNLSQTSNDSRVNQTVKSVDKGITTAKNTKMQKAPMRAQISPITVCDGTQTNNYIPVYGLYYDEYNQINQMIYPASLLTDMVGNTINSLTFYARNNFTLTGGQFNIKLGTTTTTQFGSTPTRITGLTTVATTNMTECASGYQLVINLDQPFTYTGDNLVVEFQSTASDGSYQSQPFYGITQSGGSFYSGSSSTPGTGTTHNFLPKLTFGFQPTDPTISATPSNVTFEANPNESKSQTVNVTGLNLTEGITATLNNANGVFSISPTSLSATGGELTITYSPSAIGTHSATITLTSAGANPVTISLNGTCEKAVTVCDGTNTNGYLPIYGYYIDNYQINQMIYPADELANLVGTDLTSMTFFTTAPIHADLETSTWTIKLGTTDETVFASSLDNSTRLVPDDITTVTQGYTVTSGINTMTIVFDTPFPYNGGNLLVDFQSTAHTSDYQSTGHNTGFHSYSSSVDPTVNGHYSGGGVDNFLPKVKFNFEESDPVTDGTVSPTEVDFGAHNIGGSYTATVTVSNTGNQPFTPTIDISGLANTGFTLTPTTSGEIAGHGKLDLTVTFSPTEETTYDGSFTVTIPIPDGDDLEFTVTVTGSGYDANTLKSNTTEEIPVYKSGVKADGTYIFSQEDVENDIDMSLSYEDAGFDLQVLVKSDEPIVRYDLHHKVGDGNWTYPDGTAVATATHSGNTYVVDEETFTIPQDATELWIPMTDEGVDATEEISYVPVTVANSIVAGGTQGNTYGAPISTLETDEISLEVQVGGSKSDQRPGGHWTQTLPNGDEVEYCVYTPVITINSEDLSGQTHVPYMFRAWLIGNDDVTYYDFDRNSTTGYLYGTQPLDMPKPLGELVMETTAIGSTTFTIGRDWIAPEGNNPNDWDTQLENAFAAPCEGANVYVVVRAYYQKAATRGNRDGGGYGFGQGGGGGEGIATWVMELNSDRQVVGVTYVNPMGMTSDRPFEGMNIIVTRYSDGSCRTSKVMF